MKIDLKGKKAFIAGIGDDQGFGWAIAKALAECGADILIGTWVPILNILVRNNFIKAISQNHQWIQNLRSAVLLPTSPPRFHRLEF